MASPKILALAGSARQGSVNVQLLQVAVEGARKAGAEVTVIDMRDYPLPLFDEDLEKEGMPENVNKLRDIFIAHDGLLIASPEYNSSITPLLKNLIDWLSRPSENTAPLAAYKDKVASLMSASPGGLGGLRGLVHVRAILGNIGVLVLPKQVAVGQAFEAFTSDGGLKDKKQQAAVEELGSNLVSVIKRLNG